MGIGKKVDPMEVGINKLLNDMLDGFAKGAAKGEVKKTGTEGSSPVEVGKAGEAAPKKAEDQVIVQGKKPNEKFGPDAVKKRVVQALFRSTTGIALDPVMKVALAGPMKAAALMFIENPKLAQTVEGAEKFMQLMANVIGFKEFA